MIITDKEAIEMGNVLILDLLNKLNDGVNLKGTLTKAIAEVELIIKRRDNDILGTH